MLDLYEVEAWKTLSKSFNDFFAGIKSLSVLLLKHEPSSILPLYFADPSYGFPSFFLLSYLSCSKASLALCSLY